MYELHIIIRCIQFGACAKKYLVSVLLSIAMFSPKISILKWKTRVLIIEMSVLAKSDKTPTYLYRKLCVSTLKFHS